MSTCFSFPLKVNENLSYLSQVDGNNKRDWKACFGWYYAANYCGKNIYFHDAVTLLILPNCFYMV